MAFWSDLSGGGGGGGGFFDVNLSKKTSVFGLRLWVVLGACVGAAVVLLFFLLSLCLSSRRRGRSSRSLPSSGFPARPVSSRKPLRLHLSDPTPPVSKDISEIPLPAPPAVAVEPRLDLRKAEHRRPPLVPEVSHLGWGRCYTLRELQAATGGFADENVIGEGGYGIVYRGRMPDNTLVAIKNLLNNRGQAEREFKVEVDAIGRVRHKNLVRLLGYCVEGEHRMLVYEYLDNGSLDEWLHGDIGEVSPLTWDIRVKIILGTAKGLSYLHEGLEPKVVHRDVKSSNILLDQNWNPKVSDFGLAKLLCSERSYITTRVMGTFGYVAPEYASTGMLNERSDVYSFGVLIMEIISGRSSVDYSRPNGEITLVDWLKTMVGAKRSEEVVDSRMPQKPCPKVVKRMILVALLCVDPDAQKRPKMGHVVHMLERDNLLTQDVKINLLSHDSSSLKRVFLTGS
ncbi:probable serine/threonine-protein kinase At1g01540 [Zingiber officinale]|uniref:non-specific serine/threonine protein kinase n=1 Tax=Zingiber officinale TaxID=94328 RepID=A0A8J5GQS0_ZINOF|nr:probable serine/threonine-protein kinase At1g01540 [Zingiber officinale]KAG6504302.1 hypothetical protein ZIOFF_036633 [Zingiber officinale]